MARWLLELSAYNMSIEHCAGHRHGNADGLSQMPCRQCGRPEPVPDSTEGPPGEGSAVICPIAQNIPPVGTLSGLGRAQAADPELVLLRKAVEEQQPPTELEQAGPGELLQLCNDWDRREIEKGVFGRNTC